MSDVPSINPYAPPLNDSPVVGGSSAYLYRDGNAIVVPRENASLPPRCVRCNAPASKFLLRRLYWHPPALYLLIIIGLCVYVIPALIVRKKATVQDGLCDRHSRRRWVGILIGWFGFVGGLTLFFALIDSYPTLGLLALLAVIATPVVGVVMAQVIAPRRMDERSVWLKVGRPFLESVPAGAARSG